MRNIIHHPLVTHKLTTMRKKETTTKEFRQNLHEIAGYMAYEATKHLPMQDVAISTPLVDCVMQELKQDIVLVPILRAGLGMVDGFLQVLPDAKIAHVGLARNEETLQPHAYFEKYPKHMENDFVIVLDPMLATGGSAACAIDMLKKQGAKNIALVCLVGTKEGLQCVEERHPDVDIHLAALDETLNAFGYIVPGLGDAGDRIFGTLK